MKMVKKAYPAFTLVELLVVISIIAVLLSILMPALSKVRDQATKTICTTRLKDIIMAFNLYANANNNKLPTSYKQEADGSYARWPAKITPYYDEAKRAYVQGSYGAVKGLYLDLFHCPTQERKYKGDAPGVYGYNVFFSDYDGSHTKYNWRRLVDIKTPGELPLLGCTNGGLDSRYLPSTAPDEPGGGGGLLMFTLGPHPIATKYGFQPVGGATLCVSGPAPNHRGQCNFAFADFHVQARNICNKNNWPWYSSTSGNAFHPKGNSQIRP